MPRPTDVITTRQLRDLAADPETIIVDTRPLAAFNGWPPAGAPRGGHLPGAVAFPSTWLTLVDPEGLDELVTTKRITPDRTVVLYGDDTSPLESALWERGHRRLLRFDDWGEWLSDPSLPLESLPRYQQLVYPEWLGAALAAPGKDDFKLFHVSFGVPEEYDDGHIPGAFFLDTNWLESAHDWNRRSPAELEEVLTGLGITAGTTVVLYGRDTVGHPEEKWPGRRAGQIAATRALTILKYAGVEDVRLLDGGYDWWVTAGYPLETAPRRPQPVAAFGATIPGRPEFIIDIGDAKAILADPAGAALVSVRTWREHTGQTSGYNYIEPKGRIAGDVWGNCGSDAYHMQHYRNVDNTMRAYPEIAANWEAAGITPDKWVAFYCGTGWRASETWFYAHLMGWERIAVYDGGWFEWSQDPVGNAIEVGEPKDGAAA
jgi:3-mercaptopyruvate sulfurtransferase SseA